ncbi:prepilin peptidase [Aldersonia sp. NBC_00410]|uniref:prepilin peptidase n=1 Tax=Aldersonia sp. NBC_00410 TaxID=2975954 RepID=UPI00225BA254|nr:prepilin peptidase [Aldersonia sp. NBC_00410]MCX5045276.1 prepilin peptidase [Aldersonia sp. NBC_00410]
MAVFVAVVFVAWCCWLTVIDLRQRRLPNALTAGGSVAVLLFAALTGRWSVAVVGGLLLFGGYLLVHLTAPQSLGAGDVKLAFALGAATALAGPGAWVTAALLAPVGTALAGSLLRLRAGRSRAPTVVAHGPGMCLASVIALALSV